MMLLYDFCLVILFILFIPKLLYQKWRYGKYKHFFKNRFGSAFYSIQQDGRELIWIHAVSVGETKAVAALAKKIKAERPDCLLLVTSITETGHEEALRSMPFADHHLYLPIDLSFIIRPIVKRLKPNYVILSETDLWYHFLDQTKLSGAKIFLVNGKISPRSCSRLRLFISFAKRLLSPFNLLLVQSKRYAERFHSLQVPNEKIMITGNLKLDQGSSAPDLTKLQFLPVSTYIVGGSTHPGEEEIVLNAYVELLPLFPALKLILVPRHPERFDSVWQKLQTYPFTKARLSERPTGEEQVLLIDAMGLLNACYSLCTLALVGGSFVPGIGGHNILEPANFAKPVIFGPFMHTQLDFVEAVLDAKAGIQTEASALSNTIANLLKNPSEMTQKGKNGLSLLLSMQGATKKTYDLLFPLVDKSLPS